jgi:hypothetical protein
MIWSDIPVGERSAYSAAPGLRLTLLRFLATDEARDTFLTSISDLDLKAAFQADWHVFETREAERLARLAATAPPPPPHG